MAPEPTSVVELTKQLDALESDAASRFAHADSRAVLEELRVEFLGKKGALTTVLRAMGSLGPDERPLVGKVANRVRDAVTTWHTEHLSRIVDDEKRSALGNQLDVTLPGRRESRGNFHPITKTTNDILDVLGALGFCRADGPQIEHDFYNFEALNMPPDHPARDMQDTFYLDDEVVLRTHTSPVQIRTMLSLGKPPIRIAAFGPVFRNDHDATHSPMFHQIEGLYVDQGVTFGDLKGTLQLFVDAIFAPNTRIRLRPSFFPFTEPSAEVDIGCFICDGKGCRLCKGTGFIEIMGAGMVDPEVFRAGGLDAETITGFAFGIGVERVAMLRYGISDIRLFFENDTRFLRQFR